MVLRKRSQMERDSKIADFNEKWMSLLFRETASCRRKRSCNMLSISDVRVGLRQKRIGARKLYDTFGEGSILAV